ncbi:hypothetical protein ACBJ59_36525 [Nonomuraea sp. MTCD27]|uniref:hypothetical protein n=1 Tax=Nonomuraea sp. MTCD27 TaxID=1676747 RepID=UPI0035BFFD90
MVDTAPYVQVLSFPAPAVSTANASDDITAAVAPFDCTVTAVAYITEAAVTGAATNNRTVSVVNKGQAGAGSTTVASLTFGSGTNAVAYDETTVTLSGTAANLDLAAGDVLQWRSIFAGTGIADPGGLVRVTVTRR